MGLVLTNFSKQPLIGSYHGQTGIYPNALKIRASKAWSVAQ
jgi:hypothetical protein